MGILENFTKALNDIRSNVWSIMLIGVGVMLILKGHPQEGSALITGAFAVFRSSSTETAPVPPNALNPPDPSKSLNINK